MSEADSEFCCFLNVCYSSAYVLALRKGQNFLKAKFRPTCLSMLIELSICATVFMTCGGQILS